MKFCVLGNFQEESCNFNAIHDFYMIHEARRYMHNKTIERSTFNPVIAIGTYDSLT